MAEGGKPFAKRTRKRRQKERRVFKKPEPKWKLELREIEETTAQYADLKSENVAKFTDLPLSKRTQDGLQAAGYSTPTEIQREAIPLALNGRDVLGAAKTGSGKTLAFLIPVLETLWRERWTSIDGLGALIISPTRELAYQTFEVLRKVGQNHDFSAGLVIGGKDTKKEQERIRSTNIIICTPGRLLQHMDETPNFECSSLRLLVLDEADRILDLGFQRAMNAIIENLPLERQTLLFSATQTKSVRDLARLSLNDPEYVAVHEHSKSSTPHQLTQSYVICELAEKLNVLHSFLKNHLSCKTIVFMSSCKQVKYVYEVFRRLRPGVPLMSLYGRQKQMKRVGIYNDFCKKKAAVLLCTDIAARGLDFPAVHWVVQLDCPEDANTYIHRVGRTARYEKDGKALLFLLPSEEEGMLEALQAKKIPIEEIRVNPKKMTSIQRKLESFCAQDSEMKHWAQRSFICYIRSIHLQSNKEIFNVHKLPTTEYANSLGLAQPPRIRFLQKAEKLRGRLQDTPREKDDEINEEIEECSTPAEGFQVESESDEDVLRVKRVVQPQDLDREADLLETKYAESKTKRPKSAIRALSKVSLAKKIVHKRIKVNTHVKFDEEGAQISDREFKYSEDEEQSDTEIAPVPLSESSGKLIGGISIEEAQKMIKSRDKVDRKRERERIKTAHRERRKKLRRHKQESEGVESRGAVLAASQDEDDQDRQSDSSGDDDGGKERIRPPVKRPKMMESEVKDTEDLELYDDEELALHLLTS